MKNRAPAIPDLWKRGMKDAENLYLQYLARLMCMRDQDRIVLACRRIRQYAKQGPGIKAALFTFFHEKHALLELKDYRSALRQCRLCWRIFVGRKVDFLKMRWTKRNIGSVEYDIVPLLYLNKHYSEGQQLLEKFFDLGFPRIEEKKLGYYYLRRVFSTGFELRHPYGIGLAHFYEKTGKLLLEWKHWPAFIRSINPGLYRKAGFEQEDVAHDLKKFAKFARRLEVLHNRPNADVSYGERDILDSQEKVAARDRKTSADLDRFRQNNRTRFEEIEAKLQSLFPELRGKKSPLLIN